MCKPLDISYTDVKKTLTELDEQIQIKNEFKDLMELKLLKGYTTWNGHALKWKEIPDGVLNDFLQRYFIKGQVPNNLIAKLLECHIRQLQRYRKKHNIELERPGWEN